MRDSARIEVRAAQPHDESEVRSCVHAAYPGYLKRIDQPPAPMLDDYPELIGRGVVKVATQAGQLVGLIVMWPEEDHFYVDNLAVHPDAQGAGVGSILLAEADEMARQAGRGEIRLYERGDD